MSDLDWVQLDGYGQVIGKFSGSYWDLRSHLEQDVLDVARTTLTDEGSIYLPDFGRTVICPMVTMQTPWGRWRYIPATYAHF
jgi:hypothetical protein